MRKLLAVLMFVMVTLPAMGGMNVFEALESALKNEPYDNVRCYNLSRVNVSDFISIRCECEGVPFKFKTLDIAGVFKGEVELDQVLAFHGAVEEGKYVCIEPVKNAGSANSIFDVYAFWYTPDGKVFSVTGTEYDNFENLEPVARGVSVINNIACVFLPIPYTTSGSYYLFLGIKPSGGSFGWDGWSQILVSSIKDIDVGYSCPEFESLLRSIQSPRELANYLDFKPEEWNLSIGIKPRMMDIVDIKKFVYTRNCFNMCTCNNDDWKLSSINRVNSIMEILKRKKKEWGIKDAWATQVSVALALESGKWSRRLLSGIIGSYNDETYFGIFPMWYITGSSVDNVIEQLRKNLESSSDTKKAFIASIDMFESFKQITLYSTAEQYAQLLAIPILAKMILGSHCVLIRAADFGSKGWFSMSWYWYKKIKSAGVCLTGNLIR